MKKRKISRRLFRSKNNIWMLVVLIVVVSIIIALVQSIFARVNARDRIIITEFKVPADSNNSGPYFITSGADGNLWFTKYNINKIGRITPNGKITEFEVPSTPGDIALGQDGNLWFTEVAENKIAQITLSGDVTEFTIPTNSSGSYMIARGPNGDLWFTESSTNKIGRITLSGIITEYTIPTSDSGPQDITTGPDGNLWFTEYNANKIGRITPDGDITEFAIPTNNSTPLGIASGPDGNLWFTEYNNTYKIGRITTSGEITEFVIPTDDIDNSSPNYITSGPDGNLWYTRGFKIGRITPSGNIIEFSPPSSDSNPSDITSGPDGNIWYTDVNAHTIGRVNFSPSRAPNRDSALLSPFNDGVTWTVYNGYLDNRDQSKAGCGIGSNPLDHCRSQLFGLDLVPDQQSDKDILAPSIGQVTFRGNLVDEDCIGVRITLDNGLNMNVCHFASFNVKTGDRVERGKVLGVRSTSHVHLSLDDRYRIGTLCTGGERCFLPVPFDSLHSLEKLEFNPDPDGETVTLPYSLCNQRKVNCQFKVGFQQYRGTTGTSTNVAIP